MNRILFERDEIDAPISAGDPRAQHMVRVLGVEAGDVVEVGIIGGPRGTATIAAVTQERIELEFDLEGEESADSPFAVSVLLGHPRPIVLKRILKDLTTLGVERILVAGTDTGEKSYLQSSLWEGGVRPYLVDGAAQAGVTYIPEVSALPNVGAALDFLEEATVPTSGDWNLQLLAMDNQPFHARLSGADLQDRRSVLAVGSERGFSDRERIQLRDRGFALYSMGSRVLRTETAAVCATAVVLAKIGYV